MRLVLLLIIVSLLSSCTVYESKSKVSFENYPSGELRSLLKHTTRESKEMSMYDHYKRWDVELVTYYKDGKVKSRSVQKYKNSNYGKPCSEIESLYIEYHESGKKKYYQKDNCDCKTSTIKTYNAKGRLLYKMRSHQKRIE